MSGAFDSEMSCSLLRLADAHFQRADTVDAACELVAGLELRHAGRRARHDDVAGGELHLLGELPDCLRHVPDHLLEVARLGFLAVDGEPDLALGGMADLRDRLYRGGRCGAVERLADLPGTLLLARGDLEVAAGEVDADGVAVDMVQRLVGGNVEAAALQ